MNISFNELRRIKNALPHGAIKQIADELQLSEDTVRNYFGGTHYETGNSAGIHVAPGPDGGIVTIEDPKILEMAKKIIGE